MHGDRVVIIEIPGATQTAPSGINDRGQIVGLVYNTTGVHGFLRDPDGTVVTLDVPGALGTEARGISASGKVVGDWGDGKAVHGFEVHLREHEDSDIRDRDEERERH